MNRRKLITGLISFVAAPAIVRATSIMPIKALAPYPALADWLSMSSMLRHPNSEWFEVMQETNALLADMTAPVTIRTRIPYPAWRILSNGKPL